jgi:hypothetical protein
LHDIAQRGEFDNEDVQFNALLQGSHLT